MGAYRRLPNGERRWTSEARPGAHLISERLSDRDKSRAQDGKSRAQDDQSRAQADMSRAQVGMSRVRIT